MSQAKFIVGLPRTRTYWFNELLKAHNVAATHELIRQANTRDDYQAVLECGVIDCTSLPLIPEGSKVVYISRNLGDVVTALLPIRAFSNKTSWELTPILTKLADYHINQLAPLLMADVYFVKFAELHVDVLVASCLDFLGVKPNMELIREFQTRKLTAPYLETTTPDEYLAMSAEITTKFFGESHA